MKFWSLKMTWNVQCVRKLGSVSVSESVHTLYVRHFAFPVFISVQCVPKLKEAGISLCND
jgi:hypothetical protein